MIHGVYGVMEEWRTAGTPVSLSRLSLPSCQTIAAPSAVLLPFCLSLLCVAAICWCQPAPVLVSYGTFVFYSKQTTFLLTPPPRARQQKGQHAAAGSG